MTRGKPRVQRCGCCDAAKVEPALAGHPMGDRVCRLLNAAVSKDDGCTLWVRYKGQENGA